MTTPDPTPEKKPGPNYAVWFLSAVLLLIFFCGACGVLLFFTAFGRGFIDGFCSGFPLC